MSDQIKTLLNSHLEKHPEYEDWMIFDSVEIKEGGVLVPRFKSPKSANQSMPELKAREIYGQVCQDILP